MLSKKVTAAGIVISVIVSFLFLISGMYIAVGIDLYNAIISWGYDISFTEALKLLPELIIEDAEIRNAILFDNIIGIVTFILAAILSIWQVRKDGQLKNRAIRLM